VSNHPYQLFSEVKDKTVAKHTLDGPAKKKVKSLAAALDADNAQLISQRWSILCGMLGQRQSEYHRQIVDLLTEEQAARLARMTSFEL
jgi:hypothetical protein